MKRDLFFAIPGDIETKTGGYAYDRRMIAELEAMGWTVRHLALPGPWPRPTELDRHAVEESFTALPDGATVLVDGLAFGALPELALRETERLDLVALVHHPLADETGLSPQEADLFRASERRALAGARMAIVTSPATARTLEAGYGVEASRIIVAEPGTDQGSRASLNGEPPLVLSIGTLIHRKGHDILLRALSEVVDLPWTCRIVGGAHHEPRTAEALRDMATALGLSGRIEFVGEVDDTGPEMANADLFVLATRHEGYGMVFAEAMSSGLPILATRVGAVPEVVPEEARILVEPDDAPALADALRRLLTDPAERRRMGEAAFYAASRLPSWRDSAMRLSRALEGEAR